MTVHVAYGGAHLLQADSAEKWRTLALAAFENYLAVPDDLAALGVESRLQDLVHGRVRERLRSVSPSPLAALRIDFEDGYGVRPNDEEDAAADRAAATVLGMAAAHQQSTAYGIRPKAFAPPTRARAVRTLARFFAGLGANVPAGFVVTLPKVYNAHDVSVAVGVLSALEQQHGFAPVGLELMAETPELFAVLAREGLTPLHDAAEGRLRSLHFGAYDMLSALGVPGHAQALDHPYCTPLRLALAQAARPFELPVYDGATLAMPVPVHRGESLSEAARSENRSTVRAAMAIHAKNCDAALGLGLAGSWDLHPAQLVPRYVATTAFYLRALPQAQKRLGAFLANAARATRAGQEFDDAASARGLVQFLVNGLEAGALVPDDLALPVTPAQLRELSFDALVAQLPR